MNKDSEYIRREKEYYGKIFVDASYAVDNISPFLEKDELSIRKYYIKLPAVKKYIDLLEAAEMENKKSFFGKLFSSDNTKALLDEYKRNNFDSLRQLEKCSGCSCINCTISCSFDHCLGCRAGSKIESCDHKKINITLHSDYFIDLTNDRTGNSDRYKVLATLQNCQLDQKYIIIKNVRSDEKFVLYYYPGISEDTYGEITDAEEFDFVVSTFESLPI